MCPDVLDIAALVEGRPYEPFIVGDVGLLPLSRGRWAVVDACDFPKVRRKTWWLQDKGGLAYARSTERTRLHHEILTPGPGQYVDHRNRDGLDCRRANLRLCSAAENARNRRQRRGASGYIGVYLERRTGRFQARVKIDRKDHVAGNFDTAEQAARARDDLARRLHGEFAQLNFPHPTEN